MNSDPLQSAITACADSHRRLLAGLAGLTDDLVLRPSLLPNWTVGHVLTHLARNADGLRRMLEGAQRGEVLVMYEGGADGRNADIEAGAIRSAQALTDDVRSASQRLEELFASSAASAWDGHGLAMTGEVAMRDLPGRRRSEVEIHRVDLGLGYTFDDWPADYLRAELMRMTALWASRRPMGLTGLPAAALALAPADRLAWLTGRLDVPGLQPAGLF